VHRKIWRYALRRKFGPTRLIPIVAVQSFDGAKCSHVIQNRTIRAREGAQGRNHLYTAFQSAQLHSTVRQLQYFISVVSQNPGNLSQTI